MQGHTKHQSNHNQPNNHSFIFVLRHGLRKVFLGLYSYLKSFSSRIRHGVALPLPWRSRTFKPKINYYISNNRRIRIAGISSAFVLALLTIATLAPLTHNTEYTGAIGTASETVLTLTTSNYPILDLAVNRSSGTFSETSSGNGQGSFTVTTTNYTGYTLSISNSDSDTALTDSTSGSTIASISSSISSSTFNTTTYNGKWGYKPSKYYDTSTSTVVDNSSTSTGVYLPSPTTTATTLNITNCANGKSNGSNTCPDAVDTYTIDLAARLEYTQDSGSYTNTFILTAVGNPIDYTVNYNGTGADSGTTPGVAEDETNLTYITLSSITPTKDGYTFKGWCTVDTGTDGTNACTGTTYQPGDQYPINQTTQNVATLYAMWEMDNPYIGEELYDVVASMSKGTQTAADLQATITTSNSGVYEYNASVFGAASDAANTHKIYYYRGILDQTTGSYGSDGDGKAWPNYVRLANSDSSTYSCWRIVRTTGSGGVKMIYNGTWTGSTCANSQSNARIQDSAFDGTANSSGKSIVGVGYTYNATYKSTTSSTQAGTLFGTNSSYSSNTTSSTIKGVIDTWYTNNLASSYSNKLELSAGYCNDRSVNYGSSWATYDDSTSISTPYTSGSSATVFYFGARMRNRSTAQTPTLGCPRSTVDLYTTKNASNGNKQLGDYPIALLTADEASFAGSGSPAASQGSSYNTNSYLRSGSYFWLLSPNIRNPNGYAIVFYLSSSGDLGGDSVYSTFGVRPAISLNPGMVITAGNGTATSPWEVDYPTASVPMQSYTASMCQADATNSPVNVTDSRDNKTYTVRYINGACWMTSNLRFTETTLSSSTSNVASTYTDASPYTINQDKSASAWKSLASDSVCKGTSNTVDNTSYQCMQEGVDDNNNATVWYNYAGATAGTITGTSNSTAATYDICPKNWHLPTSTEINGFDGTNNGNATYATQFAPVYGGYYGNGSLDLASTYGFWWSATAGNTTDRYRLDYYSSILYSGSSGYGNRNLGFYVRCVRSS